MDPSEDSGPNGTKGKTNERSPLKNDEYSTINFDWNEWKDYDRDWRITLNLNIKEVRLMYSFVSFYLDNFTGSPHRPPDEEIYLVFIQGELYKMIQEYTFTHNSV